MTIHKQQSDSFWSRHVARGWTEYQWSIIGLLALVAFALGVWGFFEYFRGVTLTRSGWSLAYHALQLFTLEFPHQGHSIPWQLDVARFLAPGVVVYTAAKAFVEIFRDQLQLFRVRFQKGHVIICGLGEKGYLLCRSFCAAGYRVVVIELHPENSRIRLCRDQGAIVLTGSGKDKALLRQARLQRARYLFAVCGDDGANAEIGAHVQSLAETCSDIELTSFIHISNPDLAELLREKEISTQNADAFRLEFFNIYERGARTLLLDYPLSTSNADSDPQDIHIIIVGLGALGSRLLINVARLWKRLYTDTPKQLRVTLVDPHAETIWAHLTAQYPRIDRLLDIELVANEIQSSSEQLNIQDTSRAYICLDDDSESLSAALKLRLWSKGRNVPIIVCMHHDAGLSSLLDRETNGADSFSNLDAFGLLDRTCTSELLLGGTNEIIARAIHDSYVREQRAAGHTWEDNPSLVAWEELPDTLKRSNRRQADHISTKLKSIDCDVAPLNNWDEPLLVFTDAQIESLAEMEHVHWVKDREADGWRYTNGEKDIEARLSPYLAPWENLTEEVKGYDRDTVRHLPAFLAKAGFEVYRRRS